MNNHDMIIDNLHHSRKSSVVGNNHNSISGYSIAGDYLHDLQEDQEKSERSRIRRRAKW